MSKPTEEDFLAACGELSAIPFFPSDSGARTAVARALRSFVSQTHHLRWLVDTSIDHMRQWGGVAELRGIYCTRFKPADGVEGYSSISGFTPADSENAYLSGIPAPRQLAEADQKALERMSPSGILPFGKLQ